MHIKPSSSTANLRSIVAFVLALGAAPGVWAGSNLESAGYPVHQCGERPTEPLHPESFETESAVNTYNKQAQLYNATTEQYFECIQMYVNNAAEDIKLIRRTVTATIEAVNQ